MRLIKAAGFGLLSMVGGILAVLYFLKVVGAVLVYGWPDPNGSPANVQVGLPFMLMIGAGLLAQWSFRRAREQWLQRGRRGVMENRK